jgi:putative phage-type endonuclease
MEETALDLMREYCQDHLDIMHKDSFTIDMMHEVRTVLEIQFGSVDEASLLKAIVWLPCGRTSYHCPPMTNVAERIDKIRNKPQPQQRTQEWYEYRHTLLTASVAYKALGTDAKIRELLKRKEAPVVIHDHVCTEGPLHWGVKYEHVSIQYYEYMYQTKVEEFGCVTHDTYSFLGASPDGINVSEGPLHGRMLEVKNPFTREITGIPKEEYWVQCQLQMEVCDLDACDFLETKFVEYESEELFRADGSFQRSQDGKLKGIYLQFFTTKVHYEYAPFQCTEQEYEEWESRQFDGRTWIATHYWKLDDVSCVLIRRQPEWFKLVLPKFINIKN